MNLITINTDGLEEGIRCILCKNNMKTEFGCDGSCVVDDSILAKICDEILSRIEEKYRWHDLRKNPDDLPCKDGLYAITTQYDEELSETGFGQYESMYGYTSGWSATMPSYGKIIAWKEIEPFEVKE